MQITYSPIGIIHSPFHDLQDMPIQPTSECSSVGTIEVFPSYAEGLRDLEGFSHIVLIYWLHKVTRSELTVVPFLDTKVHGIFATRSPVRPNPIGLSVVKLTEIAETTLHIDFVDVLDGTPLLDLKPYVPEFDSPCGEVRVGWFAEATCNFRKKKSDGRFTSSS